MIQLRDVELVFLDCDGVILDTNQAKLNAFRQTLEVFETPSDTVDRMIGWQQSNFGTSRYKTFEALKDGKFGSPPKVSLDGLLREYAARAEDLYEVAQFCTGVFEFLGLMRTAECVVVSGSDQSELRRVFEQRRVAGIAAVYGSPIPKSEHISNQLRARRLSSRAAVMIGDAIADLQAAESQGVFFCGVTEFSADPARLKEACQEVGYPVFPNLFEVASVWGAGA